MPSFPRLVREGEGGVKMETFKSFSNEKVFLKKIFLEKFSKLFF